MKRYPSPEVFLLTAGLVICLGAIPAAPAPGPTPAPTPAPADNRTSADINFESAKIKDVLSMFEKVTGAKLIYAPLPDKNVTVHCPDIPQEYLFAVFEAVLEMNGVVLVPAVEQGLGVYKVVPVADSGKYPSQVLGPNEKLPLGDRLVTQVIELKYIDAQQAQGQIGRILTNPANIVTIVGSPIIVVTDYASKIERIKKMLELMDVSLPEPLYEILKLEYISPDLLVEKLKLLITPRSMTPGPMTGRNRQSPPPQIVPDTRTNSVILYAMKDDIDLIKRLVKGYVDEKTGQKFDGLDVKGPSEGIAFNIHPLKNTNAADGDSKTGMTGKGLASILTDIFEARKQASTNPAGGPGNPNSVPTSGNDPFSTMPVRFVPEPNTNSLIVIAPQILYEKHIRDLIEKLDRRRPQVLIKAVIMELSDQAAQNIGIELATADSPSGESFRGFGGTLFGLSALALDQGNIGRVPNVATPGVIAGIWKDDVTKIPLLLKANQQDQGVDVVAIPSILVNDNSKGTLTISDTVQVPTTSTTSTTSTVTTNYTAFEAKTELEITPHISEASRATLVTENTRARASIALVSSALDAYKSHTGRHPSTGQGLKALLQNPGEVPVWKGPYIEQASLKDPWDREFVYSSPGLHGDFDIISYGADGRDGGDGENMEITSWDPPTATAASLQDYLRLEVKQTVEQFTGSTTDSNSPPPKTSRVATTVVTLPNASTLVIGGLTRTVQRNTLTGIPVLSKIPLLGYLFRSTSKEKQKSHLYIFITPLIFNADDFSDLASVSSSRRVTMEELQKKRVQDIDRDLEDYRRAKEKAGLKSPPDAPDATAAPGRAPEKPAGRKRHADQTETDRPSRRRP
ncbi:MAG: type II secretion system protein GspG [Planctomycetota bacterium]